MRARVGSGLLLVVALALPSTARAQRAAYARPEELRPEGLSHLLDVSLRLGYARVLDPDRVQGLANVGTFSLRARALLGRNPSYCVGLDGEVGGADTGFVYGLTAHVVGVGGRWGEGNAVALCGGAGFDGVVGAVPLAARFPAELSAAVNLGPLRLTAWAGVAWVAGADARREGSTWLTVVDEVDAGLTVRLGRQHRLWASASAGRGPSLGVVYRELMGTRFVGVVLGLDLSGAQ